MKNVTTFTEFVQLQASTGIMHVPHVFGARHIIVTPYSQPTEQPDKVIRMVIRSRSGGGI